MINTGSLFGGVTDNQGRPLPGATITLTGQGASHVQVTDVQGRFRFPTLAPGTYTLEAQLEGYSSVTDPNVIIEVGRSAEIELTMNPAITMVRTRTKRR